MATLVNKTIGTGGDYATWAAFIAAAPASLVALDEQWTVTALDGAHLSSSASLVLASKTTSATCYFHLTAQSIGGASITNTGTAVVLDINVNYTRISKLKIASTNNTVGAQPVLYIRSTATNCDVNQCVLDGYSQNTALRGVVIVNGATSYLRNTVVLQRSTDTAATIAQLGNGAKGVNVSFLSLNATMAIGVQNATVAGTMKNCYVGNATAPEGASFPATKTTCASSAGGTGWATVPFSTATFVNLTTDFKLATGSALIDAGTNDATYAATDAEGVARPQGAVADIGAYEYQSSGGSAPGATLTGASAIEGGAATGGGSGSAPGATLTGTSSITGGVAMGGSGGTLTTRPQKNNAGTVMANEAGAEVFIWDAATGALVLKKTGVTLSAAGVAVVIDALIIPGTSYSYDVKLTGNRRRCNPKVAT